MPCAALCTSSPDAKPVANPQLNRRTRRATLLSRALRSVDEAPRNPPEKLASPRSARTRNRWSGACTPARGARPTSGRGGGGSVGCRAARISVCAKVVVDGLCLCSRLGAALLNVAAPRRESPETAPFLRIPGTFGFLTRRSRCVENVGLSHRAGPASAIPRRGAAPGGQGRCAGRRRRGRPPHRWPRAS